MSTYRPLTEGEKVNLNTNANQAASGGLSMILLGVPCLLFPPLGLFLIISGVVSLVSAGKDAVKLESGQVRI